MNLQTVIRISEFWKRRPWKLEVAFYEYCTLKKSHIGSSPKVSISKLLHCIPDILLGAVLVHLAQHHGEEVGELEGAGGGGVHLQPQVLHLRLARVLAHVLQQLPQHLHHPSTQ